MSRHLVFRPQAESEILDAHRWYEDRRAGLGHDFVTALDACVAAIRERPLAYPRVHGETRRALLRRYPYALYFRLLPDDVIVVLAVMHRRQHQRRWQARR